MYIVDKNYLYNSIDAIICMKHHIKMVCFPLNDVINTTKEVDYYYVVIDDELFLCKNGELERANIIPFMSYIWFEVCNK